MNKESSFLSLGTIPITNLIASLGDLKCIFLPSKMISPFSNLFIPKIALTTSLLPAQISPEKRL
jgi:hypothetical protein